MENGSSTETKGVKKGRLTIFLGTGPGMGKTCAMLKAAHQQAAEGVDIVVGWVETYHRPETKALLPGLQFIKPQYNIHQGRFTAWMDLNAIMIRHPRIVLIDELADTNPPGMLHNYRYQDVEAVLDAGMDVWTTLNLQNVASIAAVISLLTGASTKETVPDRLVQKAEKLHFIGGNPILIEKLLRLLE